MRGYVPELVAQLVPIMNRPNLNKSLLENTAITLGRLGAQLGALALRVLRRASRVGRRLAARAAQSRWLGPAPQPLAPPAMRAHSARAGLVSAELVAPLLEQFIHPWCTSLRNIRDDIEKVSAGTPARTHAAAHRRRAGHQMRARRSSAARCASAHHPATALRSTRSKACAR